MALEEKADKKDLSLVATTGDYNHLVNKPEKSDTLEGYGIIAEIRLRQPAVRDRSRVMAFKNMLTVK